jgi:hypothetical protein
VYAYSAKDLDRISDRLLELADIVGEFGRIMLSQDPPSRRAKISHLFEIRRKQVVRTDQAR